MSTSFESLHHLFAPESVAVVGGSPRHASLGRLIHANLLSGGFAGPVAVVSPKHPEINGRKTAPRLQDVTPAPDLVIVTAPPHAVPQVIADAVEVGARVAVVVTAGMGRGEGGLRETMLETARKGGLRIVGPNCLGVLAPRAGLNASFAQAPALPGDLALLSQSGAIVTSVVDWANNRGVGFSGIVSLGDMSDIDVGYLLDHFALDPNTRAILLYIEAITDARTFMSAARAAARAKPVVVVKSGRNAEGARAVASHTGALAGSDAVYDAAFRRAGLLRVPGMGELFEAAETLSRMQATPGERLAIVTNGGGLGVLAVDDLIGMGGTLADLGPETMAALEAALPQTWSHANPIDIIGDADPARFVAAVEPVLADRQVDAVMVVHCPTALATPADTATAIADLKRRRPRGSRKPLLPAFVGSDPAPRAILDEAGLPLFRTPAAAVRGFMHLVKHRRAQAELMATPASTPEGFNPAIGRARAAVRAALDAGRSWLTPVEVAEVLAAYDIPAPAIALAGTPDEAADAARPMLEEHGAVVIKIQSHDIVHKSDVGGVVLNLDSPEAVREAAAAMLARVRERRPEAAIEGILVQPMVRRPHARELIMGLSDDPMFGPVVLFGAGGVSVEVVKDTALGLPPLTMDLAHDIVARTRVSRVLEAYRDTPAADREALAFTLVKLAQLAADLPEVREADLNPVLAGPHGVIVLDARVSVQAEPARKGVGASNPRFAIRPYPRELERTLTLEGGWQVFTRPVRPDDTPLVQAFLDRISPDDLRQRFFGPVKTVPASFTSRLTQIDYDRVMVFLALDETTGQVLGTVQVHREPGTNRAEYAILVGSNLKGKGLGWALMSMMIGYARDIGLEEVHGEVLRDNTTMLRMCQELGFSVAALPGDPTIAHVTLPIAEAGTALPGSA